MAEGGKAASAMDNASRRNTLKFGTYSSKEELNNRLDQRKISGDGGTSSNTVEVQGLSAGTSQELVEMYFENSRRSGGGDIDDVQILDGVAYITFEDAEIAQRVASRCSHQVAGQTLTVSLYHPPPSKPCYDNRVLVCGLNSAVTEELLIKFLLTETGAKVTEILYGDEEGKVVVTFSDCIDFEALRKACKERRIEDTFLQVAKVVISNCILVCNLQQSTCQDAILLYFENKRRSGGGDVERVEMMLEEGYCIIYFEDNSVIARVLSQTHKIDGADVKVHIHHECLGRRSSARRSQLCLKISDLGNKDITTFDNKTTENSTNEIPCSVSSDYDKASDFIEVPELQQNDGNTQVLKLLIMYLRKEGKKNKADISKHLVSCTMNFKLMWRFYTKTDCGRKMLDVIVAKHHCKVSLPADKYMKEFFIFQVSDVIFQEESDVKNFVDGVIDSVYICAQESLSIDLTGIDPRIQDDVREKLKERKELDCSWIKLVGEGKLVMVCTVCCKDQQQFVMQIITEVITDATKSFNSHIEMVTADFMWQMVMTKFEYLKEIGLKFPSTEIMNYKNLNAFLLKGPRDEVKAAAGHLEELLKMAHKKIHEEVFSPGYQFEIFAFPEMCGYIDNSLPKLPVIWIPNHQTKEIHLFSKDPEQLKGIDKCIKGCIKERLYPLSKDNSKLPFEKIHSVEEIKKQFREKLVIHHSKSPTGLFVTSADDIFFDVDAAVQKIVSNEITEVHPDTCVPAIPDGRDGQLVCKPEMGPTNTDMEKKDLSLEKASDSKKTVTKTLEVKDKILFKKVLMVLINDFKQIAKEHYVTIEVVETQSRVGFLLKGQEKEMQHICEIISIAIKQMQLQQDIRDTDCATEKVPMQMTPNPCTAGKSEGSKMPELKISEVHKERDTSRTNTTIGEKGQSPKRSSNNSADATDHMQCSEYGAKADGCDADDICIICSCPKTIPKALSCGHFFCSGCIDHMFKDKPVCPVCGKIVGILTGDQPKNGKMSVNTAKTDLAGYEGFGSIIIIYDFPAGRQEPNHPSPGTLYPRMLRIAYLPNTSEGRTVCRLLQLAFGRRLVFTISRSQTTGREGLTWNDIHHKTNLKPGGQFGYPDPDYLSRVKDELAAKGITEADLPKDETGSHV